MAYKSATHKDCEKYLGTCFKCKSVNIEVFKKVQKYGHYNPILRCQDCGYTNDWTMFAFAYFPPKNEKKGDADNEERQESS